MNQIKGCIKCGTPMHLICNNQRKQAYCKTCGYNFAYYRDNDKNCCIIEDGIHLIECYPPARGEI